MSQTVEWIDPDGNTLTLPKMRGTKGFFGGPVRRTIDTVPGQAGGRLQTLEHDVRSVSIPVYVDGDPQDVRDTLREWMGFLDPRRGDGRLRVTSPDASQRELTCRLNDGWDPEEQLLTFQRMVLVFEATDPYWYDPTWIVDTFMPDSSPATFFPFFPLRLSSSESFADFEIDNLGQVETWPIWNLTGPFTGAFLHNLTTGEDLELTQTIGGGESVTIDTRPGHKTVVKNDGTNLFPGLSVLSSLWPIIEGSQSVRIELTGFTDDTLATVTYQHRYHSV